MNNTDIENNCPRRFGLHLPVINPESSEKTATNLEVICVKSQQLVKTDIEKYCLRRFRLHFIVLDLEISEKTVANLEVICVFDSGGRFVDM